MLDGESSLVASGLQHYEAPIHRVSVPRGVTPLRGVGLDIRRTRRWSVDDLVASATAEHVGRALLAVRRDRRRELMHAVVNDMLGGVRSLGELDFARECRRRGMPEPDRQVLRRGKDGRWYLDVCWDAFGLVVEIDGIHHSWATSVVPDALRQNEIALGRATVLRLPLLGLRVAADDFFDQVERGLRDGGWCTAA